MTLSAEWADAILDQQDERRARQEPPYEQLEPTSSTSPVGGPRLVPGDDYREVNRAYWNSRAPAHAASPGYGVQRFMDDATFLSDVVRFDLPRLGDIAGLTGVHLQCHNRY